MFAFLAAALSVAPRAVVPGAADLATVRERLIGTLVPSSANARTQNAATARSLAAALRPDGSWPDIDYTDRSRANWKALTHTARLVTLATAYRAPGGPLARDPVIAAAVARGLRYWVDAKLVNPNWWHNDIGAPKNIGETLVLMGDELEPDLRKSAGAIIARVDWSRWTGQNLVWGATDQIMLGCATGDAAVAEQAFQRMYAEIRLAGPGKEGIQPDGSFHQHGPLLYSGGYGLGFTVDASRFIDYARGTAFACPPDKVAIMDAAVLDGQRWMIQGSTLDYSACGREITRPRINARGIVAAVDHLSATGSPRATELAAFAGYLRGESDSLNLTGNRHFWMSDYMCHRRNDFLVSIRMYSSRLYNTDGFINGENRRSHHIADGAMMVYRAGGEYADIFPVWDWKRVPGTTCLHDDEPMEPRKVQVRGTTDFVGGASDGRTGLAAMDLRRDGLSACKAWFCLDREIVCLGAGIASSSPAPVLTSVNQCLLTGPVTDSEGAGSLPAGTHPLRGPAWICHAGVGYVIPAGESAVLRNDVQSGRWSDIGVGSSAAVNTPVFSIWIDHGVRPAAATYEYRVFPSASSADLRAGMAGRGAKVLSNTGALQAIHDAASGITQCVFRQPGRVSAPGLGAIQVDQPCLLQARPQSGCVALTLSNPRNAALAVAVRLAGSWAAPGATVVRGVTSVRVALPGGAAAGSSVTVLLRHKGRVAGR